MTDNEQNQKVGAMVREYRTLKEAQGALNQRARRLTDQVQLGQQVLSGWYTATVQEDGEMMVKRHDAAPPTFDRLAWPTREELLAFVMEKARIGRRLEEITADLRQLGLKPDA